MKKLLMWLQAYFVLGIVGDDDTIDGGGGEQDDDPPDLGGDDTLDGGEADDTQDGGGGGDDTMDAGGGDGQRQETRGQKAIREARRRAQDAEERARQAEERYRASQPRPVTEDDRIREQEDTKLRDPKTAPLEKWQIESNRALREGKRAANQALAQAQDLSDKTSFDLACQGNKRLAAVRNEVEERVKQVRASGQGAAPREAIARFIIGDRVLKAPAKKAAEPVNRGKLPGARSDVHSRGNANESEKRKERLRGVTL